MSKSVKHTRKSSFRNSDDDEILDRNCFENIKNIGQGAFGTVYLVRYKGKELALKEIKKAKVHYYKKVKAVFREESMMELTNDCEHIIKFQCTFQDEKNLYFLMNYA